MYRLIVDSFLLLYIYKYISKYPLLHFLPYDPVTPKVMLCRIIPKHSCSKATVIFISHPLQIEEPQRSEELIMHMKCFERGTTQHLALANAGATSSLVATNAQLSVCAPHTAESLLSYRLSRAKSTDFHGHKST